MRNKYSDKFEKEMKRLAPRKTLEELLKIAIKKYNYDITKNQLRQYFYKREIRYKDYSIKKVRSVGDKIPIGSEYRKSDGMILVKISKNKWQYKNRLMYEKYHNCKLTSDDFIVFLNQDRNDFSKENLKRITRRESAILSNQKMFSKDKDLTNLGILTAKLMIKSKKKEDENEKLRRD